MTTPEDTLHDRLRDAVAEYFHAKGIPSGVDLVSSEARQLIVEEAEEIKAELARQTEMAV